MSDSLQHFGVLGMKWGRRKGNNGVSGHTRRLAKKDAQRHVDAKMFYGETAGTKRKLLKAEIDRKKKNIPGYEEEFNANLQNVDTAKSAKKAVRKRIQIDTVKKGRQFVKKALGITGSIGVAAATTIYLAKKREIDGFLMDRLNQFLH